ARGTVVVDDRLRARIRPACGKPFRVQAKLRRVLLEPRRRDVPLMRKESIVEFPESALVVRASCRDRGLLSLRMKGRQREVSKDHSDFLAVILFQSLDRPDDLRAKRALKIRVHDD